MIFVRAFIWTWVAVLATWLVFLVVVGPLLLLGTGFALGDWPAWMIRRLRETPYLGVHPFLLLWSTAVSLPAWLVLRVSGMGRRWPKTSRVLYVSAFMWFSLWLMGLNLVSVPLAFAGCLIAPLISFGVFLAAFLGFAFIWGDGAAFAQMLLVGSMIAARLLPRGSCAHPPPADAAGATPIEVTSDADTADVRLRMVLTS